MPSFRIPGVLGQLLGSAIPEIDQGTLARVPTSEPGIQAKPAQTGESESDGFVDASYADITSSVGNGFCVPLVQQGTSVGHTSIWRAGAAMSAKPDIVAGTVIATFNSEGKYESKARGNHAAFFVEYKTQGGVDGIMIYDQYREWPDKEQNGISSLEATHQKMLSAPGSNPDELAAIGKRIVEAKSALEAAYPEVDDRGRRFRRKQPGKRFIGFGQGNISNNANSYSVVVH